MFNFAGASKKGPIPLSEFLGAPRAPIGGLMGEIVKAQQQAAQDKLQRQSAKLNPAPVTPPPSLADEKLPSMLGKRKGAEPQENEPSPAKVQKTTEEAKKPAKPKKADKGEPCKSSGEKEEQAIKEIKKVLIFNTRKEFETGVLEKLNGAVPKPKFRMENKDKKVTVVCTECKKFKLRFTCDTLKDKNFEMAHFHFSKAEGLHK